MTLSDSIRVLLLAINRAEASGSEMVTVSLECAKHLRGLLPDEQVVRYMEQCPFMSDRPLGVIESERLRAERAAA